MTNNPTQPDIVALINEVVELEKQGGPGDRDRVRKLNTALGILLAPEQFDRLVRKLYDIYNENQARATARLHSQAAIRASDSDDRS